MSNNQMINNSSEALRELLFQLADDDFILSYRGSEWLGLAPHIEEDVAFSSISQDTMGHAAIFYQLLENLGVGDANDLAHHRPATERRNAILLEKVNGPGHYLVEPRYDWAFAVVRNYFYVMVKKVKMDSLKNSSHQPLSHAALRVNLELYYHILHWKTWFTQLLKAGGEARTRMEAAIGIVTEDMEGLFHLGAKENEMVETGLINSSKDLNDQWFRLMTPILEEVQITLPPFSMKNGNGRIGEHTKDLDEALATLKEVYQLDPTATW
ncbi:1,2-phenylacetyl-CoA epoxidase subunit PaaC [Bacillus sp. CGMCC 1.16607]|uniref:1,2-phenylacetyl-CoA epoxidase subunit PaaC n=1 Tax=Bacillus sp. CGMCC 1.16607 TaxID=3351842 RepID=UPI00362C6467